MALPSPVFYARRTAPCAAPETSQRQCSAWGDEEHGARRCRCWKTWRGRCCKRPLVANWVERSTQFFMGQLTISMAMFQFAIYVCLPGQFWAKKLVPQFGIAIWWVYNWLNTVIGLWNIWKSPFLMGKHTISMAIFQFAFCMFTRPGISSYIPLNPMKCHWITIIYPIKTPFSWVKAPVTIVNKL